MRRHNKNTISPCRMSGIYCAHPRRLKNKLSNFRFVNLTDASENGPEHITFPVLVSNTVEAL